MTETHTDVVQRSIGLYISGEMREHQSKLKLSFLELERARFERGTAVEADFARWDREIEQLDENLKYYLARTLAWVVEYNAFRATREPHFLRKPVGLQVGWPFEINIFHATAEASV